MPSACQVSLPQPALAGDAHHRQPQQSRSSQQAPRQPQQPPACPQILNDWFNKHHLDRKALAGLAANLAAAEAYHEHVADEVEAVLEGLIQAAQRACPDFQHTVPSRAEPAQPLHRQDRAGGPHVAFQEAPAAGEVENVFRSVQNVVRWPCRPRCPKDPQSLLPCCAPVVGLHRCDRWQALAWSGTACALSSGHIACVGSASQCWHHHGALRHRQACFLCLSSSESQSLAWLQVPGTL